MPGVESTRSRTPTRPASAGAIHSGSVPSPWWERGRPFLNRTALERSCLDRNAQLERARAVSPRLSSFPASAQDSIAADDVLSALLGIPGSFIFPIRARAEDGAPAPTTPLQFKFCADSDNADDAVPAVAQKVLALADDHAVVASFVEMNRLASDAGGHVRQALAVALEELLEDYRNFVLRLEDALRKGELTLQRLLYYAQPSMRSMALLRRIVSEVGSRTGGAALNAVFRLAAGHVGSADARDVLTFIVGRTAAPIIDTMHTWISEGLIDDTYREFFVVENHHYSRKEVREKSVVAAKVWEMRYTINAHNVPEFLSTFVENILRAGKYLNVLTEADVDIASRRDASTASTRLVLDGETLLGPDAARKITNIVDRAFSFASRQLLQYFHNDVNLLTRLHSVKRYFFLEQGDLLVHFFDAASEELAKPRAEVSISKLSSLLELSVRTSVSANDPYHEDLRCVLFPASLATQLLDVLANSGGQRRRNPQRPGADGGGDQGDHELSGYDMFSFDYTISWPVSLIVSKIDVIKYQLLFRYLFHCKYVERELEGCWTSLAQVKGANRNLARRFARTFALRHRMLQFLRNMLFYAVADVLEPNWRTFEASFEAATTIDEILTFHSRFLDTCISQCMLSNENHIRVFYSVSKVCLLFASYTEQFTSGLTSGTPSDSIEALMSERKYGATIAKFETAFDSNLRDLLDGLSNLSKQRVSSHLANLCERLDYGGFYERMATQSTADMHI